MTNLRLPVHAELVFPLVLTAPYALHDLVLYKQNFQGSVYSKG